MALSTGVVAGGKKLSDSITGRGSKLRDRGLVEKVKAEFGRIDILVNNAN